MNSSISSFHSIFSRVENLSKNNNFANNLNNFALSTMWLSNAAFENGILNRFFLKEIMELFNLRECPSLALSYIIFDGQLKNDISLIFNKYNKQIKWFSRLLDGDVDFFENVNDDLLINIYSRDCELHKHLVININALMMLYGNDQIKIDEKNEYINLLKKYNIIHPEKCNFNNLASLSRSMILAMTKYMHNLGTGYTLSEALIMDDYYFKSVDHSELNLDNLCVHPSKIIFDNNLNILTGNGLSKYITFKETNDSWLQKMLPLDQIQSMIAKRFKAIREILYTNIGAENFNLLEFQEENALYEKYIISNKFRTLIVSYLETFAFLQGIFFNKIKELLTNKNLNTNSQKFNINGPNFHKWINYIFQESNSQFESKDRNYLFHSLFYIKPIDFFTNIETLLTIFDKFTKRFEKTISITKNDAGKKIFDNHYLLCSIFPESYLDYIWNNKKINKINLQKINLPIGDVYTLNYDNITEKLFKKAVHLHGSFSDISKWNGSFSENGNRQFDQIKFFDGKESSYLSQIDFIHSYSTILRGGDYKMEYMYRVFDVYTPFNFGEKFKKLSNQTGNFLIIGTLLVGDPHVFDLIGNKTRKVYITYWDKKEFFQIEQLLRMSKITNRKWNVQLVKFKELAEYLKI